MAWAIDVDGTGATGLLEVVVQHAPSKETRSRPTTARGNARIQLPSAHCSTCFGRLGRFVQKRQAESSQDCSSQMLQSGQ
jgi:hypothetical protein